MRVPDLLRQIRSCSVCAAHCPQGCRPLVQIGRRARIVVIGQAPGRRAHASGTPWSDASGERLREWMGVVPEVFYDAERIALMPMGFCYPGTGASGDLPPRPECAPLWHERLLAVMPQITLTLLIGQYALDRYAADLPGRTLTERIAGYRTIMPTRIPLVHPSPRNGIWLRRNQWFVDDVIPQLRAAVRDALIP